MKKKLLTFILATLFLSSSHNTSFAASHSLPLKNEVSYRKKCKICRNLCKEEDKALEQKFLIHKRCLSCVICNKAFTKILDKNEVLSRQKGYTILFCKNGKCEKGFSCEICKENFNIKDKYARVYFDMDETLKRTCPSCTKKQKKEYWLSLYKEAAQDYNVLKLYKTFFTNSTSELQDLFNEKQRKKFLELHKCACTLDHIVHNVEDIELDGAAE